MITATDRTAILHAIDAAIASLDALSTVVATLASDSTAELVPAVAPLAPADDPAPVPEVKKLTGWRKRRALQKAHNISVKKKGRIENLIAEAKVQQVQHCTSVAPVAPLSVSEDLNININSNPSERENGIGGTGERVAGATLHLVPTVARNIRHSLPADWQPDEHGAKFATDKLGEIGAANCLAKFRRHHATSGRKLTAVGWQNRYCDWVMHERAPSPGSLVLFAKIDGGGRQLEAAAPTPSVPADACWAPILANLTAQHGEDVARSWFANARLGDITDSVATVSLPTKFLCSWLKEHYANSVFAAIATVHPDVREVQFVVRRAQVERSA